MEKEIWRAIKGYEDLYEVSNFGRVKSLFRYKKVLKPIKDINGYLKVNLYKNGNHKFVNIHKLVANAFIDNPKNFKYINHKDEDKTNNRVENLEWCSFYYNLLYGTRLERTVAKIRNNPKKSKKVLCVETGVVYLSTHDVERKLGFNSYNISRCCNNKHKTHYGYHWKYVEED